MTRVKSPHFHKFITHELASFFIAFELTVLRENFIRILTCFYPV